MLAVRLSEPADHARATGRIGNELMRDVLSVTGSAVNAKGLPPRSAPVLEILHVAHGVLAGGWAGTGGSPGYG